MQRKVRLAKWYSPYAQNERSKVVCELSGVILNRGPKLCNIVEWRGYKVVYERNASMYFCMCIDQEDNELEVLEIIHRYVELLHRYFHGVSELDLIFNFHLAYYILDELLIAGELQESSMITVGRTLRAQDELVGFAKEVGSSTLMTPFESAAASERQQLKDRVAEAVEREREKQKREKRIVASI